MSKYLAGGKLAGGNPERGRVEDDFYATDPKSTRALLEEVKFEGDLFLEPCCGQGHIAKVIEEYYSNLLMVPGLKETSGLFFKNKYDFIINYLPFINCNKIILTGVKNMFEADIQIDDKLGHLKNNVKTKFMFTSYHNKNITDKELEECGVVRVNSWSDIAKHLL